MASETMIDLIREITPDALIADGFDDAIIGYARGGASTCVVAYCYDKCVNILIDRDGMSHEEAVDWMEYNVIGSYVGENGPIFMTRID